MTPRPEPGLHAHSGVSAPLQRSRRSSVWRKTPRRPSVGKPHTRWGRPQEAHEQSETCSPSESDLEVQRRLLLALGTQGEAEAVRPLLDALVAPPSLLRRPIAATASAQALGRLAMRDVETARSAAVTSALLQALDHPDVGLQRGAAFALARQAQPDLPPPVAALLEAAARAARDATTRAFLVRAVASASIAADPLLEELSRDRSAAVRIAVARAAARQPWPGVAEFLDDEDDAVRLEAIAAIGHITEVDRGALLQPYIDRGATLSAAEAWRTSRDPSLHEAAAAIDALGAAGLLEDASGLCDASRPTRVRVAATAWLDDPDTWVRLSLEDGEGPVRTAAAVALVEADIGAPTLRSLLPAFDPMVAAIAAEALFEKPHKNNQAPLLDLLAEADDPDVLAAGMRSLTRLYTGSHPKVRKPARSAGGLARTHAMHASGPVRRPPAVCSKHSASRYRNHGIGSSPPRNSGRSPPGRRTCARPEAMSSWNCSPKRHR